METITISWPHFTDTPLSRTKSVADDTVEHIWATYGVKLDYAITAKGILIDVPDQTMREIRRDLAYRMAIH